MHTLPENTTLKGLQNYVKELEKERGFDGENIFNKCILLGEEVGELFKAIRKETNSLIDHNSNFEPAARELADILIILSTIANRLNIDLEEAIREKEEINRTRNWSRPK